VLPGLTLSLGRIFAEVPAPKSPPKRAKPGKPRRSNGTA
jgi:hypothetical protein